MAVCAHGKTGNGVAATHGSAVIEDIQNLTADGETDRLLASGRNQIDKSKPILPNVEDRDVVTARVYCKQEAIRSIHGQCALIAQSLARAGATGGDRPGWKDVAVRRASEYQYCISTA